MHKRDLAWPWTCAWIVNDKGRYHSQTVFDGRKLSRNGLRGKLINSNLPEPDLWPPRTSGLSPLRRLLAASAAQGSNWTPWEAYRFRSIGADRDIYNTFKCFAPASGALTRTPYKGPDAIPERPPCRRFRQFPIKKLTRIVYSLYRVYPARRIPNLRIDDLSASRPGQHR